MLVYFIASYMKQEFTLHNIHYMTNRVNQGKLYTKGKNASKNGGTRSQG